MANKLPPTISANIAGSIGVIHLPRLWQKMFLAAKGMLADGYKNCGPGFDMIVLDGLGVDKDKLIAFVDAELPTYTEFEKFVVSEATMLNQTSISQINAAITDWQLNEQRRAEILDFVGLENSVYTDAVSLNNLDDWQEFYEALK